MFPPMVLPKISTLLVLLLYGVEKLVAVTTLNLNPIFERFPGCLQHITSFDLNHYMIELNNNHLVSSEYKYTPFLFPVILSHYKLRNSSDKYKPIIEIENNSFSFVFPPKLILYNCAVQLYINLVRIDLRLPTYFAYILFPALRCNQS